MKKTLTLVGLIIFIYGVWGGATFVTVISAETETERRERLEKQLQQIEIQMIQSQRSLEDKQQKRQSLERDISILDGKIHRADLGLQARRVVIEQLNEQIGDKAEVIKILDRRLVKQSQSLADLLRKVHEVDDFSLVEVLLSNQDFSEFFTDFESLRSVNSSLGDSLRALRTIKNDTREQKDSLETKQVAEAELKIQQEQEKKWIERQEREKARILYVTKGEEKSYQQLLTSQQKTVFQLRAQLFTLLGSQPIPFPKAVDLAITAGGSVGVEPALILAILEQESEYGSNIGSCALSDKVYDKDIMHPDRDKPIFLAMAETLDFDPKEQAVSCPLISNNQRIGWGGAMGASQFIPSTWAIYGGGYKEENGVRVYKKTDDHIRRMLGKNSPSNPFNHQDAFTATALLLRDNGADSTYHGDRLAALRYYAGYGGAKLAKNQFYGDQVAERKNRLNDEIRILQSG